MTKENSDNMKYVIKTTDMKYVAKLGSKVCYTTELDEAHIYNDKKSADNDRFFDTERVLPFNEVSND